ncbi:glycosyltransferase [Candidatus Saccharibacteria bacterium]|nr:glycosyltransferase [Candidatus Saccharibacteria bacterium]
MQPKVSLIITVYNKAPFLRRCLDSVKNQVKNDAQIIVVDDGSTDGSAEICDEYDFEIYHIENGGVSEARNFGMNKAKGEYITFLDSDDILTPKTLNIMEKVAGRGFNIYQFGQYRCKTPENCNKIPYASPKGHYDLYFIPKYWVMVWNKLYKKSFLEENHIRFQKDMSFGEDAIFNMQCILANGGLYHAPQTTIIHCLDDKNSLCRGNLNLEKIEKLDAELNKIADQQIEPNKIQWARIAVNEHRNSRLFKKYGFNKESKGEYDIVYMVKDEYENEELRYSLRSVEQNWKYRNIWFCGGCPNGLKPDKMFPIKQEGFLKWDRVRDMLIKVCENDDISENFWLFNDDFFILKPMADDMQPQYNGELIPYIERIEKKHQGREDAYTSRLRQANNTLKKMGYTTFNYEVHKPMLINRKKALEVLKKFEGTPCFRSLYGNYYAIGGINKHDMKIKVLNYGKMYLVEGTWEFLSTSDDSFNYGQVGTFLREKFYKKCRFEL